MHKKINSLITSIGSTSWAMTTSWAFFCSTSVTTVLTPVRTTSGRLVGVSCLPAALSAALLTKRARRSFLVSGRYLSNSLNNCEAKNKWKKRARLVKRSCKFHPPKFERFQRNCCFFLGVYLWRDIWHDIISL